MPTSHTYVSLSVKEKFGYGLGDFASNLSFGFVSLFLLFFYTDVYGITAAEASLIFVIARVIDAIFNLAVGVVVDKTHTRWGKMRPYLLFGAIPLGALTVLCFVTMAGSFRFGFALLTYTLYCLAYTTVNTPYSALTNTLTQNEKSRASLSVYRFALASIGYLVVSTTAGPVVELFDSPQTGYTAAVVFYSILAAVAFLMCFCMTWERVNSAASTTSMGWRQVLRVIFRNGPLLNVSLYTALFYIAYTVWMAIAVYFIRYVIGDAGFSTAFFMIQTAAYTTGVILSAPLIAKWGKKAATQIALSFGMCGLLLQYFFADGNLIIIMIGVCSFSLTLGAGFVTMWSMVPDTVEYAEWHHKSRAEGVIYGFYNFVTKIAMALGGGCAGLLLDMFDYSSDAVSETALEGINFAVTLFPAILFGLCIVVVTRYKLNETAYRDLLANIRQRSLQGE